ncbi:MAG TPA: helix-turn-helix transcriptional regulator [Kineosporiaceae bacterium]|nr:helix-turn-helix transcriptional regulator [Kineosporiaceae bacterium]
MTEAEQEPFGLAGRLRELRAHSLGVSVTQRQLAEALGISVPLISSWESPASPALPPEERLQALARFYATPRSLDGRPHLLDVRELTQEEERVRRELIDELVQLRELGSSSTSKRRTGALGGRFYYFPDGLPVRIIDSRFSPYEVLPSPPTRQLLDAALRLRELVGDEAPEGIDEAIAHLGRYVDVVDTLRRLVASGWPRLDKIDEADWNVLARGFDGGGVQYANPWHPNAVHSLWHGDMDAIVELHGHIRAENPGADVRWMLDTEVQADDLTGGHVVILGGGFFGDSVSALDYLRRRLNLPLDYGFPDAGSEYEGRFVVTLDGDGRPDVNGQDRETHFPRFLTAGGQPVLEHGQPVLEYDVALLSRFQNPLNLSATITICTGVFSRGTYGSVRALTDSNLRARNETYLGEHLDLTNFWMLMHVPVFGGPNGAHTLTPDLTRPFHRLRTSG